MYGSVLQFLIRQPACRVEVYRPASPGRRKTDLTASGYDAAGKARISEAKPRGRLVHEIV